MTLHRINQLHALRNRLNRLGNHYYASTESCQYVRTHQFNESWNNRRISLRNRINRVLRKVEG